MGNNIQETKVSVKYFIFTIWRAGMRNLTDPEKRRICENCQLIAAKSGFSWKFP
jgi:hypothetical protein